MRMIDPIALAIAVGVGVALGNIVGLVLIDVLHRLAVRRR